MTQEVQITLTLEVDTSKDKEDIKTIITDMCNAYSEHWCTRNKWAEIRAIEIIEEAEIYRTEENTKCKCKSFSIIGKHLKCNNCGKLHKTIK